MSFERKPARLLDLGVLGPILAILSGLAAAPAREPIFTRAELLRATTGEVELRRAYTRRLELPLPECAEGRFACDADAIYGQAYELRFVEEHLAGEADGRHETERIDRGRLLIATDLPKQDEDALEDALRGEIRKLGAEAFSLPQAGLGYMTEPLKASSLARSARPVWVCRATGGTFSGDVVVSQSGVLQSTYGTGREVAERGCRAIARALADAAPEVQHTRPAVEAEEREEVRLRSASSLGALTWSDRLARLPQDAKLDKRALHGEKTGATWDRRGAAFRGHEGRDGKIERDVLVPPAALALVEMPMWVGEWSFTTVRESFGKEPRVEHDRPLSVVLAVVPIADPLMDDLARTRTRLVVPSGALVDAVIATLEHSTSLDPQLVLDAFADPSVWPAEGDWLVVACRDEGTASYGIAPFAAAARVTNALESCAAIRRQLE